MCKRLHGKELNNVIRANIFSFSYKREVSKDHGDDSNIHF